MLMVWRSRQDIRLYETKTVANAIMIAGQAPSAELNRELQKTWTDYREALFHSLKELRRHKTGKLWIISEVRSNRDHSRSYRSNHLPREENAV